MRNENTVRSDVDAPVPFSGPGRRIKQARGRKTYDALIATAFELLEEREFDTLTVAELAKAAGYSVGAFYARFKSRDEFFDAMIAQHMELRTKARTHLFATAPDDTLVDELIVEVCAYFGQRERFWRAALSRSIRKPEFWEPLRRHGREFADLLIERIGTSAARPLTDTEQTNVRFAFQITLGTINNTIINRPGPIVLGQTSFVANLARAFRLVSGYDDLVGVKRAD